jgi:hypothetical protein
VRPTSAGPPTPLSDALHSPGAGADLWIMGLAIAGLGTILGAVYMITTVVCIRARGMTMFRMPIFTWNIMVTSILVLMVFPLRTAALLGLAVDRHLGGHIFDPANGGLMLWHHLFWFFGHPEVYVVAIPFFGIVTEIVPVFARKPVFGYTTMIYATAGIAALSTAVWAHHMFATGAVLLPFFSFMSYLIALPTGIKFLYCCLQASVTEIHRSNRVVAHRFFSGWFTHRANAGPPVSQVVVGRLLHGGQRPAPAGQFTGDRHVGDQRVLTAFGETAPPLVEAAVARMSARSQGGLHLRRTGPQRGPRGVVGLAMMPGRLDQQTTHMGVVGLGDRPLHPRVARGVVGGHQPHIGADRRSE